MECVENHILYDEEGSYIKEENDNGHEFDDEKREIAQKKFEQSHVIKKCDTT